MHSSHCKLDSKPTGVVEYGNSCLIIVLACFLWILLLLRRTFKCTGNVTLSAYFFISQFIRSPVLLLWLIYNWIRQQRANDLFPEFLQPLWTKCSKIPSIHRFPFLFKGVYRKPRQLIKRRDLKIVNCIIVLCGTYCTSPRLCCISLVSAPYCTFVQIWEFDVK